MNIEHGVPTVNELYYVFQHPHTDTPPSLFVLFRSSFILLNNLAGTILDISKVYSMFDRNRQQNKVVTEDKALGAASEFPLAVLRGAICARKKDMRT